MGPSLLWTLQPFVPCCMHSLKGSQLIAVMAAALELRCKFFLIRGLLFDGGLWLTSRKAFVQILPSCTHDSAETPIKHTPQSCEQRLGSEVAAMPRQGAEPLLSASLSSTTRTMQQGSLEEYHSVKMKGLRRCGKGESPKPESCFPALCGHVLVEEWEILIATTIWKI